MEFTEAHLVPTQEILDESATRAEVDSAISKFYGAVDISLVPLFVSGALPEPSDMRVIAHEWQIARERSESLRTEAEKASAECGIQERQLADFCSVKHLIGAGFKVNPKEFGLPRAATSTAKQRQAADAAISTAEDKIRRRMAEVGEFVAALGQRVTLALQYAKSRRAAGQGSATNDQTDTLITVLTAVGAAIPAVRELGRRLHAFVLLAQNRGRHRKPEVVDSAMEKLATEMRQLIGKIQAALCDFKYPFVHPRGSITVAEFARYEKPCGHEFERVFRDANAHLERLFALYHRLVGQILLVAAGAENQLQAEQTQAGAVSKD